MVWSRVIMLCPADETFAQFQAIVGAGDALTGSDCSLTLLRHDPGSLHGLDDLRRIIAQRPPVGIIVPPPLSSDGRIAQLCHEMGCNHVCIAPDAREGAAQLVCSNDRQGAQDATRYLIAMGHRRIGFVSGPDTCRCARERELGYMDALAEQGLDLGAELTAQTDGSFASGNQAGQLLLQVSPSPSAIFAASDLLAAGVLHAAHGLGIGVPQQLSVIGFGDTDIAHTAWPPLTSVRQPVAEMAFTAAMKLIDPANAPGQPVEFFCELVPRSSTAPPR